jgi:mono/diheme cytochrome c family protein
MSGLRAAGLAAVLGLAAATVAAATVAAATPQYADGAAIFSANCAVCHGAAGAGTPALAPPLLSNPARYATLPEGRRQLAMTVLYGLFGDITVEQKHYNFKMPEFSQLEDARLAAVLNFVVFDLAQATAEVSPIGAGEVAAERGKSLDGAAVREHRGSVLEALGGG